MTEHGGVLIVGGGIGGLAVAIGLAQGGHQVRLLEQAPEFAEVGAGIQLAPNATRALARLGLLEAAEVHAVRPSRIVMMDAVDGELITELDIGESFRAHYGAPYIVLHRHDLLAELLAACRAHPNIELCANRCVTDVHPTPDGVEVTCLDGSSYAAAALVGADGLRSSVRGLIADDEPVCSGFVAYRGSMPTAQVTSEVAPDAVVVWVGPGLHLVQYPLRRGTLYNQVAVFRSARYDGRDDGDWGTADELRQAFAPMCAPAANAVALLDQHIRWPMYDRLPIENWTRGVITLLGDAAHPMLQYLAQGAGQALEDAAALAACFPVGRDAGQAFVAYQTQRLEPTARVQRSARLWGELWHLDGVARTVRNRYLALREATDYSELDWLYAAPAQAMAPPTLTSTIGAR